MDYVEATGSLLARYGSDAGEMLLKALKNETHLYAGDRSAGVCRCHRGS